jgi:catechol 2,3-dioxygenase-like lactoylglutathione lyase family enzyme
VTASPNTGVPCLLVRDAKAARAYYENVLGFEVVAELGGPTPAFVIVRKHDSLLLLQQVGDNLSRLPHNGPPWDAVLLVKDVQGAHGDLAARGVTSLSPIDDKGMAWNSFEFHDEDGNVICVGESRADLFQPAAAPSPRRLAKARSSWRHARAALEERPHLKEFREFYETLPSQTDVFYMFFTSGLLHWVVQAESFVPKDVNLVLVGSALEQSEIEWISRHLDRPFHHIRLAVDDVSVWEFLFAVNRHNFGWLDIDCFVLNEGLFKEMTELGDRTSLNCTWSGESGHGFAVANTHFLFLNVEAIKAVRARGASPSPCTYDWNGSSRLFPPRECYMRIPTRRQRELLLDVLPAESSGVPAMVAGGAYYNTLVVYQLLARAVGYEIHPVRPLARRCRTPVDARSTDPEHWPEDMSDELFHLFGVSYYRNFRFENGIRALYLAAEHVMLENAVEILPPMYRAKLSQMQGELRGAGAAPEEARSLFREHLISGRRLSPTAADRALSLERPQVVP